MVFCQGSSSRQIEALSSLIGFPFSNVSYSWGSFLSLALDSQPPNLELIDWKQGVLEARGLWNHALLCPTTAVPRIPPLQVVQNALPAPAHVTWALGPWHSGGAAASSQSFH